MCTILHESSLDTELKMIIEFSVYTLACLMIILEKKCNYPGFLFVLMRELIVIFIEGFRTHPRAYGSFIRVLGKFSRDENLLSLEEAISRIIRVQILN